MCDVLRSGRDLLVADDMPEPDEREVVDDLGGVDELVDVEVPVRPVLPTVTAPSKQLTILSPPGSETSSPRFSARVHARSRLSHRDRSRLR